MNHGLFDTTDLDRDGVVKEIIRHVKKIKGVDRVFEIEELMEQPMSALVKERIGNGWHPKRSGDIQVIFAPGWIDGGPTGTTHGLWNPYDSHLPMLWYGRLYGL